MLALQERVVAPVWEAVRALIPAPVDNHPLGCHRPRVDDRTCFMGILARLVTGCSWATASMLVGVGETTLRRRRDEWFRAGVFTKLAASTLEAYDRVIGLRLSQACIDTSLHKAPMGGSGTGPSHVDRSKLGWKWSMVTDRAGIPLAWVVEAANCHDITMVEDTLDALDARGYEVELENISLDRGYDAVAVRDMFDELGVDADIPHRSPYVKGRKAHRGRRKNPIKLGQRWTVERANSWLSNFGQLRRSTDRKIIHREATLDLAVTLVLTVKLVKYRSRYGATIFTR